MGNLGNQSFATNPGFRRVLVYTATGGETSVSGTDDFGLTLRYPSQRYVDVYVNGTLLVGSGVDYTADDGTSISGLSPALNTGDIVAVVITLADIIPNHYTEAESDDLFYKRTRDPLGMRNAFINGQFDIWQRGTSFTGSELSADRWEINQVNGSRTVTRQTFTTGQTDVPYTPTFYLRYDATGGISSGDYETVFQRIEDVRTFSDETITVSFYAKADKNADIASDFEQDFGTGGSPSSKVDAIGVTTYSLTTSWQKFTTTVDIPSIAGKTIGTNGDNFLGFIFWISAGSDNDDRTNSLGTQTVRVDFANVQIERGDKATPFERRPIGSELALCKRYYNEFLGLNVSLYDAATNFLRVPFSFPEMRTEPNDSVSVTSSNNVDGGFGYGGINIEGKRKNSLVFVLDSTTSDGVVNVDFNMTLDAEL